MLLVLPRRSWKENSHLSFEEFYVIFNLSNALKIYWHKLITCGPVIRGDLIRDTLIVPLLCCHIDHSIYNKPPHDQ